MIRQCPFCKARKNHLEVLRLFSDPHSEDSDNPLGVYAVRCAVCLAQGPRAEDRLTAISEWNRRERLK